jgi:hypothetical protein
MTALTPYIGLRPFHRDEASIFFGRDTHIDALIDILQSKRFLAVIGASGAGKSSLIKAGLLPALNAGFMEGAGSRWKIAEMQPRNRPFSGLAEALLQLINSSELSSTEQVAMMVSQLRCGPLSLIEKVREQNWPAETNFLLIVDQFEELFFKGVSPDEANAFIALLLATATEPGLAAYIVLTMRYDYLEECAQFQRFPEALSKNLYLMPQLTRDQLYEAIVGPARMCDGDVEPDLINDLLNEIGRNQDQLPILQYALKRMWSKAGNGYGFTPSFTKRRILTRQLYADIGHMENALSQHVEELYNMLNNRQQSIADVLFRTLSEGKSRGASRCPTKINFIASEAGVTVDEALCVVNLFRTAECSLITPFLPNTISDDDILDLCHESLIRLWPRIQQMRNHTTNQKHWTEESLNKWMQNRAYELSTRRVNEWYTLMSQNDILRLYRDHLPVDHQVLMANGDWHQAKVYLAAKVLDENLSLSDNLEPSSYWRIEEVWLRDIKKLKAYFNWLSSPGRSQEENYRAACKEIFQMLLERRRKVNNATFEPIQRYIKDRFIGRTGEIDANEQEYVKMQRLRTLGFSENDSRQIAHDYIVGFYNNIFRAVIYSDDDSTRQVLRALGFHEGTEFNDGIVNCFEMMIAIQFLNLELVKSTLNQFC